MASMAALSLSRSLSLSLFVHFWFSLFLCVSLSVRLSLGFNFLSVSQYFFLFSFFVSVYHSHSVSVSLLRRVRDETDTETERDHSLHSLSLFFFSSVFLNVVSCLSLVLAALPKHTCNVFVHGQSIPMYSHLSKLSRRALWSWLSVAGCLVFAGKVVTFIG